MGPAGYRRALLDLQRQHRRLMARLIAQVEAQLAADWQMGPALVRHYFTPLLDEYARALAALRAERDDPFAKLNLSWLTQRNPQLRQIEQNLRATVQFYAQQAAERITQAQQTAANLGEAHAGQLLNSALEPARAKGIDPAALWNRPNPEALAQFIGRAGNGHPLGDLFGGFSNETASAARQALMTGLALGDNPKVIARGLDAALGIPRQRALVISRTEILGSYRSAAHTLYRANSDVVEGWLWSAGGNNPCAMCMGMDGTLHGLYEELNDHPCFPAGMLVSGPRALGSTTRWYEGDLIDITTRDGRLLSVTPNHPILTSHGWIMAGLLEEGDDVVCHRMRERGHTPAVGTPDDYQVPSPIEQVARAFGRSGDMAAVAVPLAAEDLNGDGRVSINGQVNVVGANSVLREAGNGRKSRRQPFAKKQLHRAYAQLALLARSGASNLLRQWLPFASLRSLRRQHDTTVLLRGTFSGVDAGHGRRVSTRNASSQQPRLNGAARDAKGERQPLLGLPSYVASDDIRVRQTLLGPLRYSITRADQAIARLTIAEKAPRLERIREALLTDMEPRGHGLSALPGEICLDRVLKISIRRFSGHVYNLQTSTGWYITNDIIAHNCGKCAPIPTTKTWDQILGGYGIDTNDMLETSMGYPGAYESGEVKFARMSPEKQRAIIGTKTGYEAYRRGEVTLRDFVGVRPGSDGFPSQYYQRSLKEMQIPTRQASRLVEPEPALAAKLAAGKLRASDLGRVTPDTLMPAWAKQSEASRIVYQVLRNGLPYPLTGHEQGLLIVNLEQMLKSELPVNVRAAVERQLQALGQQVERQTVGAAARAAEHATVVRQGAGAAESAAEQIASTDGLTEREMRQLIANREIFTDPNTGRTNYWTSEINGEKYFIRPAAGPNTSGSLVQDLADRVGLGEHYVAAQTVKVDGQWYEVQRYLAGQQADQALTSAQIASNAYLGEDERMKLSLFSTLLGDADRFANNMWLTPEGDLLQIDYGMVFQAQLYTPASGGTDLLSAMTGDFAHFQQHFDAIAALHPSPEVMDWLRNELLSPPMLDHVMRDVQSLTDVDPQAHYLEQQIIFQRARIEMLKRFAALPGNPSLGQLVEIEKSPAIRKILEELNGR